MRVPVVRAPDEIDLKTTKNVKWVTKLGSQSYANPTVFNGKIFVGTNNETPRDPKHVGDRSILMCFDEKTGAFLWQLVVPKLKSGKVNDWENLGLFSSPTHDGKYLYIVTSRCEVLCLDINGMADGNDGPYKDEVTPAFEDSRRAELHEDRVAFVGVIDEGLLVRGRHGDNEAIDVRHALSFVRRPQQSCRYGRRGI